MKKLPLAAFALTQVALASPLQLIETGPGQRAWMTAEEVALLTERAHEAGHCGGYLDVTDHPDSDVGMPRALTEVFDLPDPHHRAEVEQLLPQLSAARMLATVQKLSSFNNRYYKSSTGVDAAHWIRDQFRTMARGRTDITVELFAHSWEQPSVIARIAGQGPHANERIVLGAHEDSINRYTLDAASARAPGADDDASGVATVLEVFKVLVESGYRPDRTLEFMTYSAEEVGLKGSQAIAQDYKRRSIPVAGVLQLDMTFYPGPDAQIHMISDNTNPMMNRYTEQLIDLYVHVPWTEMPCEYACSDHASWTKAGYASSFPFEASMDEHAPNIHTTRDTAEILTPSFGLHFAKLAVAYAVEMSSP